LAFQPEFRAPIMPNIPRLQLHFFVPFNFVLTSLLTDLQWFAIIQNTST